MKKNSLFSIMIATVILFSSCATTVSVKKIQPANFDIKDAKSIAILPFETSAPTGSDFSKNLNSFISIIDAIVSLDSATSEQNYIVSYLEDKIADGVIESNHFQLIDGRSVKSALAKGLPSPADIYIVGYIHNFESDIDKDYEKDEEDGEVEVSYQREVSYNISYQVINAKTHVVLGNKQEYVSGYSSRTNHRHNLESAFDITQSRINSVARKVIYNIQIKSTMSGKNFELALNRLSSLIARIIKKTEATRFKPKQLATIIYNSLKTSSTNEITQTDKFIESKAYDMVIKNLKLSNSK